MIVLSILLPVVVGVLLLLSDGRGAKEDERSLHALHVLTGLILLLTGILALYTAWHGPDTFTWFELMRGIPVYFHIDDVSRLFVTVISVTWVLVGFYSFVYMSHEGKEWRFFGFYLIVYGVLIALCFAGNLVTLYLFYELMTLTSMPMVLHNGSREAILAALKYLFYSMCGAYLGLFGIFFLYRFCDTLTFTAGGTLNPELAAGNPAILMIAVFGMLIGFGAKAGMFPMHAWLPTAHPVAPSPASAVMSGIIVKAGVLAIVRVVYFVVGPDFIRGTWIQTAWMSLTLLTVFMGSMLAFREPVFKKRLAYSTVSQASYILFGLSVLSETAMEGALLHVVFHAFIKSALFLTAGIFLYQAGKTRVEQLRGIGKQMPLTLWCFTFASLALIGIPPASGFISKWYLAEGALEGDIGVFGWAGPAILLLSALLTAGYLLPLVTNGFFPKAGLAETGAAARVGVEEVGAHPVGDPSALMLVPLAILAALALFLGVFPNPLIRFVSGIATAVL